MPFSFLLRIEGRAACGQIFGAAPGPALAQGPGCGLSRGRSREKRGVVLIRIKGQCNEAIVFTDELEATAEAQIKDLCDQGFAAGAKIRIMPDVHAGAGCTIGTTMTLEDKAVPNLVGVDIGCGMETTELAEREIDFEKLDLAIRTLIPSGFAIRTQPHPRGQAFPLENLRCKDEARLSIRREKRALGTLGGGNHFIEVDRADDGRLFLVIHSGSRHLGKEVAAYYQQEAWRQLNGRGREMRQELISRLKAEDRRKEIQPALRALDKQISTHVPEALAYCEGRLFDDYIHDMKLVQEFAVQNRQLMTDLLLEAMDFRAVGQFTTIHNYIDTEEMILRKGAVSAKAGEMLLIPLNMRDGALICRGKGNPEWNFSAPHGAGRVCSRNEARRIFSLEDYKDEMRGIFTTSVSLDTLDECPMAYKPSSDIEAFITETAEIVERIRPVYNFKAK